MDISDATYIDKELSINKDASKILINIICIGIVIQKTASLRPLGTPCYTAKL